MNLKRCKRLIELMGIVWHIIADADDTDPGEVLSFAFARVPAAACVKAFRAALKHTAALLAHYQLRRQQQTALQQLATFYCQLWLKYGYDPEDLFEFARHTDTMYRLVEVMQPDMELLNGHKQQCYSLCIPEPYVDAVTRKGSIKPSWATAAVLIESCQPLCEELAVLGLDGPLRREIKFLIKVKRQLSRNQLRVRITNQAEQLRRFKKRIGAGIVRARGARQRCIEKGAAFWRVYLISPKEALQ